MLSRCRIHGFGEVNIDVASIGQFKYRLEVDLSQGAYRVAQRGDVARPSAWSSTQPGLNRLPADFPGNVARKGPYPVGIPYSPPLTLITATTRLGRLGDRSPADVRHAPYSHIAARLVDHSYQRLSRGQA